MKRSSNARAAAPFRAPPWIRSKAMVVGAAAIALASFIEIWAHAEGGDAGATPSDGEIALKPLDGGTSASGYPPDPAPLNTRKKWVVGLSYRGGGVGFRGARRIELEKPSATARAFGRFALELYVGKELVDRVRFDFPLLGGGETETSGRWDAPLSFERGLLTQISIVVPDTDRATRAVLVDRATGTTWPLPFPFSLHVDAGAGPG